MKKGRQKPTVLPTDQPPSSPGGVKGPDGVTRRSFIQIGGAGIAATAGPALRFAWASAENSGEGSAAGKIPVALNINGKSYSLKIEPRVTLLDCLRENLSLTG